MARVIYFSWIVILVALLANFSYCQSRNNENLDGWVGKYEYVEQPVKGFSGHYDMLMGWDLVITKTGDHYQARLNINGYQTFIEYLTDIDGSSNSINVKFNKQTDGPIYPYANPVKGERLFTLKRVDGKLVTTWGKLAPRLLQNPPRRCTCFILAKR
ncbi:MAG: DUF5991 domain-containing protein [Sphingobacteriales bacterium]